MKNIIVIHNKANLFTYKFRLISLKSAGETFIAGRLWNITIYKIFLEFPFPWLLLFNPNSPKLYYPSSLGQTAVHFKAARLWIKKLLLAPSDSATSNYFVFVQKI